MEHYRQAGDGLIKLKGLVGHGRFEEEIGRLRPVLTPRHARRLMKLANEWPVDWDRWQEICGNKKPAKPI